MTDSTIMVLVMERRFDTAVSFPASGIMPPLLGFKLIGREMTVLRRVPYFFDPPNQSLVPL